MHTLIQNYSNFALDNFPLLPWQLWEQQHWQKWKLFYEILNKISYTALNNTLFFFFLAETFIQSDLMTAESSESEIRAHHLLPGNKNPELLISAYTLTAQNWSTAFFFENNLLHIIHTDWISSGPWNQISLFVGATDDWKTYEEKRRSGVRPLRWRALAVSLALLRITSSLPYR